MTSRVTFGDLALAATGHLEAPARQLPAAGLIRPSQAVAEADELLAVLPRMLKSMARYTADIAAAPEAGPGEDLPAAWAHAAGQAHQAAQNAYRCLPPEQFTGRTWSHRHITSSMARDIDAAAIEITAARDLLHTHTETTAGGTRRDRSEWAPVITSAPVPKALLSELAGWSRHLVRHGTRITLACPHPGSAMTQGQRRLIRICQSLTELITAVERAHSRDPVTPGDTQRLHGIPASVLQPRVVPSRAETIAGLHHGIAECSERARAAAAAAVSDAAWSPAFSAESFSQTAMYATVISHHCEILQQSLAARAAQLGATSLRNDLLASASSAATARQGWLATARAWSLITTDATTVLSPAAEHAADLALWTGRFAYADPAWTPASGPASDHRPPEQLAPGPGTFTPALAAIHQAASTLAALAAADYTQIRTAARTGRLLVPATQVPASARTGGVYGRAPRHRANDLLTAYRDAGTSSVKATATIAAITADRQGHDRKKAQRSATASGPRPATGLPEPDQPAGPIERILYDLGVTDPELLKRGTTLDKAASQLLAEAADQTAPQRWHSAVTRPGAVTNTTAVARQVLAADRAIPADALRARAGTPSGDPRQVQAEPMQAEP